jgi:hypothetical protein
MTSKEGLEQRPDVWLIVSIEGGIPPLYIWKVILFGIYISKGFLWYIHRLKKNCCQFPFIKVSYVLWYRKRMGMSNISIFLTVLQSIYTLKNGVNFSLKISTTYKIYSLEFSPQD